MILAFCGAAVSLVFAATSFGDLKAIKWVYGKPIKTYRWKWEGQEF